MFLMLAYVPLLAAAGISNKSTIEDRVGVLLFELLIDLRHINS